MTRDDCNRVLSAVLSALAESPDGMVEGHLYAALMGSGLSFADFTLVKSILVRGALATSHGHVLRITDRGRAIVAAASVSS